MTGEIIGAVLAIALIILKELAKKRADEKRLANEKFDKALGIICACSGLASAFAYLKQSPVPPEPQAK